MPPHRRRLRRAPAQARVAAALPAVVAAAAVAAAGEYRGQHINSPISPASTRQHQRHRQRNWGIEFANIDWQWVRDKSKYTITLVAPDRTIDLQMVGGSNQSVFGVVDKEVVDALAMDRKGKLVTVFNGSELLGRFLLDDSAAAIRDVVHCTDVHPATNVK